MKNYLLALLIIVFVVVMVGCDKTSFFVENVESTLSNLEADSILSEENTNITMGQKNALKKAKSYLKMMSFSKTGLIEQLEFEGYSTEDATFAVNNCGANWKEQAAKKAKAHLDMMAFSRDGLIEQLEFEGFTNEEAVFGATANGY